MKEKQLRVVLGNTFQALKMKILYRHDFVSEYVLGTKLSAQNQCGLLVRKSSVMTATLSTSGGSFTGRGDYQGLRRVLTYGTYDLLHYGHVRLLRRAASLGDYLIVALSTDEFNASKGKSSFYSYEVRKEMLEAVRYVDLVIPEYSWDQKVLDIERYDVNTVVMGGDWAGDERFEALKKYCEVVYLDRTNGISTTEVKGRLKS